MLFCALQMHLLFAGALQMRLNCKLLAVHVFPVGERNVPLLGMERSQRGNGAFPTWEWSVPNVGMGCSLTGNVLVACKC